MKKHLSLFLLLACYVSGFAQLQQDDLQLILPHPYYSKPNRSYIGEQYSISYKKNVLDHYIVYSIFDNTSRDFIYSGIIFSDDSLAEENFDLRFDEGTATDDVLDNFFSDFKHSQDEGPADGNTIQDRTNFLEKDPASGRLLVYGKEEGSDTLVINDPTLKRCLFEKNYGGRVSISIDKKQLAFIKRKRIRVYDVQTGAVIWKSRRLRSKKNNEFLLLNEDVLITSLPIKKQKYAHTIWYDFKKDSVLFNSEKYTLTTIVNSYQGYNYLAMQYGGAESKKPVSASYINLSTGKFSAIQTFKKDRRFNLGWYVADSLVKKEISASEYGRFFENYTQYPNWNNYFYSYYDYYVDPLTGKYTIVKEKLTPVTVDVDFFYDNHFFDRTTSIYNYEIKSAYHNKVTYFDISRDIRMYNIYALNKEILFWNGNQPLKENRKVKLIVSLEGVPVFFTEDKYYYSTKQVKNVIAFLYKGKRYTFEQFDLKYNRPDIVLERLGYADTMLIDAYRKAYLKRLKKMGFEEEDLSSDFHIPEAKIEHFEYMPVIEQQNIDIELHFNDTKEKLDRYNIWINEVPIYGMNGKSLKKLERSTFSVTENILLNDGMNKIQVSCLNEAGAESYKESVEITYQPKEINPEKLYFIGIGVDKYADAGHNLSYSVKDIRDISMQLKEKYGDQLSIDTLFNEDVSHEQVLKLKEKLLRTSVNDKVIISFSGHGLLSSSYDYYLATYDVDFKNPENKGLPYEELEWLLDSIPARQKLMLIDACHSGEVDKEELLAIDNLNEKQGIKGATIAYEYKPNLGMQNSFELMQELFTNVNKGTGATVISASGGTQFAQERGDLQNGVFTYCILELMQQKQEMKLSELKSAVGKRVEELTDGLQKPTSRNETIENDWRVW
jgi:hypothetical protein